MRALITAKLHPYDFFMKRWDVDNLSGKSPSTDDYELGVRKIFRSMQYDIEDLLKEDMGQILVEVELDEIGVNESSLQVNNSNYQYSISEENVKIIKDIVHEIPKNLRKTECRRPICFVTAARTIALCCIC
ncbi:MAG: hypothetical protein IPP55_14495 [Anaerolineales bacterium]|nr:hypothetical protein [Anaerolineales bacterium]